MIPSHSSWSNSALLRIQMGEFDGDGQPVSDPDVMLHLGDWWKSLVLVHDLREPPQKLLELQRNISALAGGGCELAVSTKRPAAMSTGRRKWRRKLTPMMGNCTSANRKTQAKRRLLKMLSILHSPQHGMDWSSEPALPLGFECRFIRHY
jgi:hypothetical protein